MALAMITMLMTTTMTMMDGHMAHARATLSHITSTTMHSTYMFTTTSKMITMLMIVGWMNTRTSMLTHITYTVMTLITLNTDATNILTLTMLTMLTMTMLMMMDVYKGPCITTVPHMTCTTFSTTITTYMTMITITMNTTMMPTMAMDGRAAQESKEKGRE